MFHHLYWGSQRKQQLQTAFDPELDADQAPDDAHLNEVHYSPANWQNAAWFDLHGVKTISGHGRRFYLMAE